MRITEGVPETYPKPPPPPPTPPPAPTPKEKAAAAAEYGAQELARWTGKPTPPAPTAIKLVTEPTAPTVTKKEPGLPTPAPPLLPAPLTEQEFEEAQRKFEGYLITTTTPAEYGAQELEKWSGKKITPEEYAEKASLVYTPSLYRIYTEQGGEAYDKAVEEEQKKFEENLAAFEQALRGMPEELQRAYEKGGVEGYNEAVDVWLAKAEKAEKALEPYKTKEGDYDVVKFLKETKGQEQVLLDAGFNAVTVKEASEAARLNLAQTVWRGMTPWDEAKGERATALGASIMAAEIIVPGVYLARHWDEMSPGEKAFCIVIDMVSLIPFVSAAARGARIIPVAGRAVRLAAAAREVGREAVRQVVAPVSAIIHPIGTVKTSASQIRNLVETLAHPKKLPECVITTTEGIVRLKVSEATSPTQAMAIRDTLTELAAKGERPIVQVGDRSIELAQSPLMREVKGGLAHATPDLGSFEKGARVKLKPGMPLEEQGWFLSAEPAPRFTEGAGAVSGGGVIPVPVKASGKVADIGKFRPADLVRLDKQAVRPLNFAEAKNVPKQLAKPLENYVAKENGRLYGSFNEWLKVKGAKQPNDIDLAFRNQNKAINDVLNIAHSEGFQAKRVSHGVEIYQKGKWVKLGDIDSIAHHKSMHSEAFLAQRGTKVQGVLTENLGEQYLRQSLGAVAKDAKAAERAKRLEKAASDVKAMLEKAGAEKRKPGIFIVTGETASKTVPSGKLWAKTAEMERKLVVGANIPKPQQKLFTRVGLASERIEIWLEKPLTVRQIAKLKAEGLIELIKQPFTPAIKITKTGKVTGTGMVTGLTIKQTGKLSIALKASGNLDQATDLLIAERAIRATRAIRAIPPTLARIAGTVSARAVARERARLQERPRLERLTPERLRAERSRIERPRPERPRPERPRPERPRPERPRPERPRPERPRPERPRPERPRPERPRPERPRPERPRPERPRPERPRPERPRPERPRLPRLRLRIRLGKARLRILLEKARTTAEKRQEFAASIAWRQGALGKPAKSLWYAVKSPYKSREDVGIFIGEPPPDAQIVKGGAGSAFRSIQTISGQPPEKLKIDLGFQDIIIGKPKKRPGEPGAISFQRDIEQKTIGDITITSTGRGKPRVTKGVIEESLAINPIESSKMPKEIALKIGSYSAKIGPDGKLKVKVRRL